ncbi:hypothetical protein H7F50_04260 [Novosphingobium flavum]|jgi:hypothetical protein|uniref:Uncharacterized protein n=1 Tax=Novosphingobium aerophilum TaxID=2839843 RepID=A0A7X1FC26_9SPHN|nr:MULTISPECIES: hypothetical protein [Novosphingobium]MBC2653774.1 hypothetical protein [Novosphingobium aerophilum]MBC2660956.1 hypothetical protein [Novosphingobium aerophilum]
MTFFVYAITPIDWTWEFLPTVEDVAVQFARHDATLAVHGYQFEGPMLPELLKRLERAKTIARQHGWEGDYRSDATPRVFFVPGEGQFEYGFAWKQENNGTTFVASPVAMPHLAG